MTEHKKYDSQHIYIIHNARLTADPKIISNGPVVLTFAAESSSDRHSTMWWEAKLNSDSGTAEFARHLKKGDTLGIEGFPALYRWGDNNEKFSLELLRVNLRPSIELIQKVKERGFAGKSGEAKKPANKSVVKARKIVDLDEE